ncbi:MAG: Fe-S cluster assembly transcriptional regulator IscR [Clostridia bacterium]
MRLTTKGRFAVTAMLDLAMRQGRGPVTLAAISERQHISLSYLEQLFGKLRRHKLVTSVRGPGGGYNLATPAAEISVAAIVAAVDEPLDATQCGGKENCHDERRCMTHDLWSTLNEKMHEYLSSVTLGDLIAHHNGKPVAVIKDFRGREGAQGDAAGQEAEHVAA